jgi:hypothetical protein
MSAINTARHYLVEKTCGANTSPVRYPMPLEAVVSEFLERNHA